MWLIFVVLFPALAQAGISGCNTLQSAAVYQAEKNVLLRLSELQREWPLVDLAGVKRDYVEANQRVWVPRNPRHADYARYHQTMSSVFTAINSALSSQKIDYQCEAASQKRCQDGQVIAYVLMLFGHSFKTVHFCPSYFQGDANDQGRTMIHEVSHAVAKTEDLALDWWNSERTDMSKAPLDAYHIEAFYNEPSTQVLKRTFWNWIWPKPRS